MIATIVTIQQKIVGSLIWHYSTIKYEKFKAIRVLRQSHGEVKETSWTLIKKKWDQKVLLVKNFKIIKHSLYQEKFFDN